MFVKGELMANLLEKTSGLIGLFRQCDHDKISWQ